ncbi:MAG: HAMP domain-containing sensor histidine kinase, partial [Chloroflexi bacterium]|nr:HAMP domain-containing sensor histidine kinase [Chloroflexota bacterium]
RELGPLRLAREQQRAFVADTSHELRSPLAVIRTSSDLLLRSTLADGDREIVEGMREVAADASTLVDEMLQLAQLSERGRTLEHGEPEFAALEEARTVLDQLAPLLAAKGSTVTAELAPAAGRARPEEVRRIVRALIENTVAHTPAGTALSVATERHGGRVTLVVRDAGPGVAADDRERIFERFARVDSARTPGEHGAGLGLAIVRAIAERRGGSAVADAAPGGGLQVSVSLPAA